MVWYRTGTLQVTNGSTTVTGTGTQFTLSKGRAGDNIVIAGTDNEIASVNSDTTITLAVAFSGPTDTGTTDWAIIPTQSRTAEMNDAVSNLITSFDPLLGSVEDFNALIDARADDAEDAAVAAHADAVATAADRAAVAADKTTVAADKATVAADKGTVAADKAIVAADKSTVATDKGIVAADKATVAADKALTLGYKNDAAASAAAAATFVPANYVLKAGDTLTGALTLSGAPTTNLHAATKKYVDDGLALKLDTTTAASTYLPLTGGTISGNLGIGTASPSTKLHVKDGAIFNQTSAGTPYFYFGNADGGTNAKYSYIGGGSGGYITFGKASDALAPTAEWARFDGSGNLGIGTTSPWVASGYVSAAINGSSSGSVLDLRQADSMKLRLVATASGAVIETASSIPLVISPAGVEKMRLTTSGYLGIGLTSPGSKLHVNSDTGIETFAAAGNPVGQTRFGVAADGTSQIRAYASMPLVFAHDNLGGAVVERMRIITNGNVGIGTTNPATKLEVSNGGQEGLQFFPGWAASACLFQARNTTTSTNINLYQNALAYYWLADGTERMRLSTSGNLSMTPPATGAVTTPLYIALGNDYTTTEAAENCKIFLYNTGGVDKYGIGVGASADMQFHAGGAGNTLGKYAWYSGNNKKMALDQSGNLHPGTDGTGQIGTSAKRWGVIFSSTGTINTSDEREKEWRGEITEAELAAGKQIIAELGFYQWKDAIEVKGSDARYHFGAKAQTVWRIMAQHGLVDPIDEDGKPGKTRYGFLCYDEWTDEEGEAQNRFGLRPDELTMFLVAVQESRLAALEATIH